MLAEAPEYDYDFVVIGGDMAYANGNQEKWNEYGRFMQPLSANYPTMFAVGDRDVEGGGESRRYPTHIA
jgi:predicted MPP superfamily phosphohydrolase